jgi:hypothetical protein
MSKNYKLQPLTDLAVLETTFTEQELEPIKKEIQEIQSDFEKAEPFNNKLAGHIKREYSLFKSKDYIEKLAEPFLYEYISNFLIYDHNIKISDKLTLECPWVNFQKKHEFNPFHLHNGVVSFVLWISIPYLYENELKIYPTVNGNRVKSGLFEFQYLNYLGEIKYHTIKSDKKYENKMILFPAGLQHCVYPFYTSDEYRISVSGNFSLDNVDQFNLEYK